MSSTDITKEVDELVHLAFRFINSNGKPTIEETIDCIRKAKSCFEDKDEVIAELSRTNFNNLNRVRDMFVKEYDLFNKAHLTKEWMYDLLNSIKSTDGILERGKYKQFSEYSPELSSLYTNRLYGIKPRGDIGGGEYMIRMMFSMVTNVTIPIPQKGKKCVNGDLIADGEVYEVKGQMGRLDGADVEELIKIISKYKDIDNGKSGQVMSSKNPNLVKDVLNCYFNGSNPYPIISINETGYVIIDKKLEWDGIDIGVNIPIWMKDAAFRGIRTAFNPNQRTIMLVHKKLK